MKGKGIFRTVDEYINLQPPAVKSGLDLLRKTIKTAAPGAEELISYQMPAYRLKGMLAYFSATKKHYGFYPTASPIIAFRDKLKSYETSKGAVRFPLDKPIPVKLVTPMLNGNKRTKLQNCLTTIKDRIDKKNPSGKHVALFFFKPMNARGCGGHPSVEDHEILAKELAPFFRSLL